MTDLPGWFRDEPAAKPNNPAASGGRPADTDPDVFKTAGAPAADATARMPQVAQPTGVRPQAQAYQPVPTYAAAAPGAAPGMAPPRAPQLRSPLPDGGFFRPDNNPGQPQPDPQGPPPPPRRPGRAGGGRGGLPRARPIHWFRRIVSLLVLAFVLYLIFYIALGMWTVARLDRIDALDNYEGRPASAPGETWLFVGSDSRDGLSAAERKRLNTGNDFGNARTDTILLLHVPDGGEPTLVSLPRDSFVTIPGDHPGAAQNKINAAYAFGGPQMLVRTVERATGMRIDHYAEVGFAGVAGTTDAVGGVEVTVQRALNDPKAGINLKAGKQKLDGRKALGYVRARYSDPLGDLGRVKRQQQFVGALMAKVMSKSTVLNPFKAARVASAGTEAVKVDNSTGPFDLLSAGRALSKVSNGKGVTTTVPIADPDYDSSAGSSVLWDDDDAAKLFKTLKEGGKPKVPSR